MTSIIFPLEQKKKRLKLKNTILKNVLNISLETETSWSQYKTMK